MSCNVYQRLAHLLIILLIIFLAFGHQIKWDVLLVGLAWRLWLLCYVLPAGLAMWRIANAHAQKT